MGQRASSRRLTKRHQCITSWRVVGAVSTLREDRAEAVVAARGTHPPPRWRIGRDPSKRPESSDTVDWIPVQEAVRNEVSQSRGVPIISIMAVLYVIIEVDTSSTLTASGRLAGPPLPTAVPAKFCGPFPGGAYGLAKPADASPNIRFRDGSGLGAG